MKYTFITTLAAIIALAIILSMSQPAFANNYSTGTPDNPAKYAITKVYQMPTGVDTPASEFLFLFGMYGFNDNYYTDIPEVGSNYIYFVGGEEPVNSTFVVGDTKTVIKELTLDFPGNVPQNMWKIYGAGIYSYLAIEYINTYQLTGAPNEGTYSSNVSKTRYRINIYVDEDENGVFYPKYINATTLDDFIDEAHAGTPGGVKVDPTPGGAKKKPGITIDDDFSQIIFTNKYWTSHGGGEANPSKTALEITNKIAGSGANLGGYFYYDVKVTQPSLITSQTSTYKAYVLDENGVNVTAEDNYSDLGADSTNGAFIKFTSGEEIKGIGLKNGQRLAFVDLHVAAAVKVMVAANPDYITKYQRTFAGTKEFTAGAEDAMWGFPRADDDEAPHIIAAGNNNKVTFTNHRTLPPPTGISTENLPFILLILLALMALAAYVAIKSHLNARFTPKLSEHRIYSGLKIRR
jgi:hypothetical protein